MNKVHSAQPLGHPCWEPFCPNFLVSGEREENCSDRIKGTSTCQAFCSESKLTTDLRIMSSVQPPLSSDTWRKRWSGKPRWAWCAQSHLILLTNPGEGGDLLRHLDDPLDRQVGQVDHAGKELVPLVGKDIHLIRLGSLMYLRKSTSACCKRHSNRHKRSER